MSESAREEIFNLCFERLTACGYIWNGPDGIAISDIATGGRFIKKSTVCGFNLKAAIYLHNLEYIHAVLFGTLGEFMSIEGFAGIGEAGVSISDEKHGFTDEMHSRADKICGQAIGLIDGFIAKATELRRKMDSLVAEYPFITSGQSFFEYVLPEVRRAGTVLTPVLSFELNEIKAGFAGCRDIASCRDFDSRKDFRRLLAEQLLMMRTILQEEGDLLAWDLYVAVNPWAEELYNEHQGRRDSLNDASLTEDDFF